MMTVTIFTLGRDRQTWTSNHRTDDHDEALQRAVQRRWGKRAFFSAEHGLSASHLSRGSQYGQIFTPVSVGNGSTSLTGRLNVSVERAKPEAREARMEKAARKLGRQLAEGWWSQFSPADAPEVLTLAGGDWDAVEKLGRRFGLRDAGTSVAGPEARELAELVADCAAARWDELRAGGH